MGHTMKHASMFNATDPLSLPALEHQAHAAFPMPQVLLVNDTAALRHLKRFLLEQAGYMVAEVLDGLAALAYLRESALPLVVVMNTCIPSVDGVGILRAVAAEALLQRHAFVLTTALAGLLPDELDSLTRDLRVPVLGKPFTEQELLTAVAGASERLRVVHTSWAPTQADDPGEGPA